MLILLPPSEGKTGPRRGRPLDLAALSFPALHAPRAEVLDALLTLCSTLPEQASAALGLGPTQAGTVARNAALTTAPTARADRVYSGVLYEALDLPGLEASARRRATARLAVTSGLFGLLRPGDRIPAYRLPGQAALPGVGGVGAYWGRHLGGAVTEAARGGLVVDLRSSAYAPFWRVPRSEAHRVATLRVLHEVDGERKVVSHFNKATKGRIVRDLLVDGSVPADPTALVTLLGDLGWRVESTPAASGRPARLDVVVGAL